MNIADRVHLSLAAGKHWATSSRMADSHPLLRALYENVISPSKQPTDEFAYLEELRKQWKKNRTTISVTDLGAGSYTTNKQQRTIRRIARTSLTPARFSRLLAYLIKHTKAKHIAELGTSLGLNTLYLRHALGNQAYTLHTFEGCPNISQWAQQQFDKHAAEPIQIHTGNLDNTWPSFLASVRQLDLIYMDANHRYAPTIRYFEQGLPSLTPKSIVVLDDIHWSREMNRAWQALCKHPKVSLSLDLFEGGILFLDPALPKASYRLPL